jgi:hypothetical protein
VPSSLLLVDAPPAFDHLACAYSHKTAEDIADQAIHNYVQVYTDGSGVSKSCDRCSRWCGWGVFTMFVQSITSRDSLCSVAATGMLPCDVQTIPRADLSALWQSLWTVAPTIDLRIHVDPSFIVRGLSGGSSPMPSCVLPSARCSNLWQRVHAGCASRTGNIVVSEVKVHSTRHDLEDGLVREHEFAGNDIADTPAVMGATGAATPHRQIHNVDKWR